MTEKKTRTQFFVRKLGAMSEKFRKVSREVYKASARNCSEQGIPIRTGTRYVNGNPVKRLTIL